MTRLPTPLSVLLVEDHPSDAALIGEVLQGPGRLTVALQHVARLADAVEAVREHDFDAVLLDLTLPDARGVEAVVHLRAARPLPIVVLTGRDDERLGFAAIDAGAADFLVKDELRRARLTRALYNAVHSERVARDLETQRNLLASVIESLGDAVVVVDRDGRVRLQNGAASRLLGARPQAVVARHVFDPETRRPLPSDTRPWSRARRGETVDGSELWIESADGGGGRWLSANIRPFTVDGRPEGGVAVLRDITERRAREAQVQSLNDELRRQIEERTRAVVGLEAANRLKAQFLDIVSHELRTPLTPIVGYARLLLRKADRLDPAQREALEQIGASGERLQAVVDQILQFQTLRSEPVTVRPRAFDPRARLQTLVEQARAGVGDAPIEITLVAQGLPPAIIADIEQITAVVERLLQNALTYTPHGRVELRSRCTADDWTIEVRDSGIGIDAEHLEFIFGEFCQVEPSMVRSHGGLGLGLAYARFLAEALGGELGVRSTPGQGSAFRLVVPVLVPDDADGGPGQP